MSTESCSACGANVSEYRLCEKCDGSEELRMRAESAEARIASVSGVTREELAKREYERGLAEGKERLRALAEAFKREVPAEQKPHFYETADASRDAGERARCDRINAQRTRMLAAIAKAEGKS